MRYGNILVLTFDPKLANSVIPDQQSPDDPNKRTAHFSSTEERKSSGAEELLIEEEFQEPMMRLQRIDEVKERDEEDESFYRSAMKERQQAPSMCHSIDDTRLDNSRFDFSRDGVPQRNRLPTTTA